LEAVLERLTFVNEETGYTIARVATGRGSDLLTVVGALWGAQPGESLRMRGWWSSHPQYGRQFEVVSYTTVLPATIQGIRRYLGSGLIKGIGPVFAERIVEQFGLDTLQVIEDEPARLVQVPGLGPKRTAKITAAWAEQKAIKEVMIFLQGVGVSTSIAVRIYKKYAEKSIDVVKAEPYRLAADVWGIGFKTADTIAQAVGIPHDSPERVKAGLQYTLSQATDSGHCYLPADQLIADATTILEVPAGLAGRCLDDLVAEEGVVREALPGRTDLSPGSTWLRCTARRCRWPTPYTRCCGSGPTGCRTSPPSTGPQLSAGCTSGPAPTSRPNRNRRSGWRSPRRSPC
jgi:exodeoxyribonuclease V alpha subunit